MNDVGAAAAALEDARVVRARLAQKVRCPPYMHALFGALYGALVAAQAGSSTLIFEVEGGVIVAGLCMFIWGRKRMGFFVNGYRKGKTRPVALALVAVYLAVYSLAAWLKQAQHLAWPALVLGALMFVIGTWASVTWQRVFRQELDPQLGAAA